MAIEKGTHLERSAAQQPGPDRRRAQPERRQDRAGGGPDRALPEAAWTAIRITQHGHNVGSMDGHEGDCAPATRSFSLEEEHDRGNRSDTSRFLVAGAVRSLWLRAKQGLGGDALLLLREELRHSGNVIIESNSLLGFLRPDLYLMVLDPSQSDFEASAHQFLGHADAFVLRSPLDGRVWPGVPPELIEGKPCFLQPLGQPLPDDLLRFVRERFLGLPARSPAQG